MEQSMGTPSAERTERFRRTRPTARVNHRFDRKAIRRQDASPQQERRIRLSEILRLRESDEIDREAAEASKRTMRRIHQTSGNRKRPGPTQASLSGAAATCVQYPQALCRLVRFARKRRTRWPTLESVQSR